RWWVNLIENVGLLILSIKVGYIKNEGGQTIMSEVDIKNGWGEYFSSLFLESRPEESAKVESSSQLPHLDCYYSRISHSEVRVALQKIGRNKAVGMDQIPIEAWKSFGDERGEVADLPFQQDFHKR
ncbi:hypothetical protein Tco_0377163, partial [Tanacetum coccineum]